MCNTMLMGTVMGSITAINENMLMAVNESQTAVHAVAAMASILQPNSALRSCYPYNPGTRKMHMASAT